MFYLMSSVDKTKLVVGSIQICQFRKSMNRMAIIVVVLVKVAASKIGLPENRLRVYEQKFPMSGSRARICILRILYSYCLLSQRSIQ